MCVYVHVSVPVCTYVVLAPVIVFYHLITRVLIYVAHPVEGDGTGDCLHMCAGSLASTPRALALCTFELHYIFYLGKQ